jgi:hypothetical protein
MTVEKFIEGLQRMKDKTKTIVFLQSDDRQLVCTVPFEFIETELNCVIITEPYRKV